MVLRCSVPDREGQWNIRRHSNVSEAVLEEVKAKEEE